jgi:hypothetical protein
MNPLVDATIWAEPLLAAAIATDFASHFDRFNGSVYDAE